MTEAVQIEAPEHWADIEVELKRLQDEFEEKNAPENPVDRTTVFSEGKVNEEAMQGGQKSGERDERGQQLSRCGEVYPPHRTRGGLA